MPKNKDLKRLVRARMQKTGESYTTALAQLIAKGNVQATPADYPKLGGMSDDAVHAKTGRDWQGWVQWLDRQEASTMPHKEIAQLVDKEHDFGGWWAQTVTVGYERIKGLREIGQRRDGSYEASKSKTFPVPVEELYAAFATEEALRRWVGDVELVIRKATPGKSVRITWEDGSSVECYFTAKGEAKSQVAIQHRKLPRKADIDRVKVFWAARLTLLVDLL